MRSAAPPTDEASAVLGLDGRFGSPAIVGVNLHVNWLLRSVDADYDSAFVQVHTMLLSIGGLEGRTF